ncbi:hypothetical protein F6B40_12990 [Microbacterium caowuchunii]|uniref:Uncharacterized protein n=1 Tax=Microbacterium caowuchunii TaxID=2614638 RepID=A0A5N0T8X0_9MICO|nr:hypothetical protein F6B40_12990 [Microbacterium caowuchunii]
MVGVDGDACLIGGEVLAEELSAGAVGGVAADGHTDEAGVLTVGHGDEDIIVSLAPIERESRREDGTEGQELAFEKKTSH